MAKTGGEGLERSPPDRSSAPVGVALEGEAALPCFPEERQDETGTILVSIRIWSHFYYCTNQARRSAIEAGSALRCRSLYLPYLGLSAAICSRKD